MRRIGSQSSIKLFCALLVCLLLAFSITAHAQSGRRAPKRITLPPVTAPAATASPANDPQPLPLPIVVTRFVSGINSPFQTRIVADAILERMQKSKAVTVRGGGEMNRAEARKRAQADSKSYIVWLWLEPDSVDTQRVGVDDRSRYSRSLVINYIIFMPGTGEVKTQGRVYQRTGQLTATSGGRIGVSTGRIPDDFLLREAGREAADRILSELDLTIPN